jgi:hypothetical protein
MTPPAEIRNVRYWRDKRLPEFGLMKIAPAAMNARIIVTFSTTLFALSVAILDASAMTL